MSDLPRLLLCSFDVVPGPTGSSRRLTEYLRGLADHFHVVVLTVKTPDHPHIEKVHGARLLRVPVGNGDLGARVQAFDRAVRRQIDSEEYALVHFTDPFGGYGLCEEREDHGYKLVYDAQTFPSQELRHTHPQLEGDRRFLARVRRQELFCLMNADRVITGSRVTRGFIHSLGVPKELVRVIRQPVDLHAYDNAGPRPPRAGTALRLGYVGSQTGWQGLQTLLRGMALALRKVPVHLTLCGPGHPVWQPVLEDLVNELALGSVVRFHPPVPHAELPAVLATFDVGVIPLDDGNRNRGQGGPLAKSGEYLAAGLPVIASDLPLTRELLPAQATRFHAPGDPEDIADLLVELAGDEALRERLAEAARAAAKSTHDGDLARSELLDLYRDVAGLEPLLRADALHELHTPSGIGTPTRRITRPEGIEPGDLQVTDPEVRAAAVASPAARPRLSVRHSSHTEDARRRRDEEAPDLVEPVLELEPIPDAEPLVEAELIEVSELEDPAALEIADDAVLEPVPDHEIFEDAAIDPWLAQLVHGWCPPEGAQFARPTPPTNFPGREGPPPPTVPTLPRSGGEG